MRRPISVAGVVVGNLPCLFRLHATPGIEVLKLRDHAEIESAHCAAFEKERLCIVCDYGDLVDTSSTGFREKSSQKMRMSAG